MIYSSAKRNLPGGNPLANALVVVAGLLVVAASLVLGFFALIALLAFAAVVAAVVGIRLWWFGRKVRKAAEARGRESNAIEGEFVVISREDSDQQK